MSKLSALPAATLRANLVESRIRAAILSGDLPPGSALTERALAESLGISKTPVREAMQKLVYTGLVAATPHHKHVVRTFSPQDLRDIEYVRLRLEPDAVRHAINTPSNISIAQESHDRALEALRDGREVDANDANRDFHRALYTAAGNEVLTQILDNLRDQIALVSMVVWKKGAIRGRLQQEHEQILALINRGDKDGAEDLMRRHISNSLKTIIENNRQA